MGIAIVWSAVRAKSGAAAMSLLAFPVVTIDWCRLALQMQARSMEHRLSAPMARKRPLLLFA